MWKDACNDVQRFFITFAEVLRAAGRSDKIDQVPNVSYMKTMLEELGIQPITEPDSASKSLKTPALDQLFLNTKKGLKEKFIAFFSAPKREGIELDATNVVLLLKMIVGCDLKGTLKANNIKLNSLWADLRQLKLIRNNISDNSLNKARRNETLPKPEIKELWDKFTQ